MPVVLAVLVGAVLALLGLVLLLPLPEVGVPLLLGGLRLLGRRFAWARRANDRVDAAWRRARAWFHALRPPVRALVTLLLVVVAVAAAWWAAESVRDHL